MPYIVREIEDPTQVRQQATKPIPLGPGFSNRMVERAAKLIVTGSGFKDPGPDWTKWELFDAEGKALACKMIPGY